VLTKFTEWQFENRIMFSLSAVDKLKPTQRLDNAPVPAIPSDTKFEWDVTSSIGNGPRRASTTNHGDPERRTSTVIPIGPAITPVAVERRPEVATVTNSWLESPNASVALQHALAAIEEHALAAPVLGSGGGNSSDLVIETSCWVFSGAMVSLVLVLHCWAPWSPLANVPYSVSAQDQAEQTARCRDRNRSPWRSAGQRRSRKALVGALQDIRLASPLR
jgi:hypothetical protein